MGPAGKAGLALASLGLAALAVELGCYFFGPLVREPSKPYFLDQDGQPVARLYEIAQFLNPESDWRPKPPGTKIKPDFRCKACYENPEWDYFDEQGCIALDVNRFGMRDADVSLSKPAAQWRAVAVGDSFTFGLGVAREDCWSQVLERDLSADNPGGVEVLNAGFGWGFEPALYQEWVVRDAPSFEPDMVIAGLCLNDFHPKVAMVARRPIALEPLYGGRRISPLALIKQALAQRKLDQLPYFNFANWVDVEPEVWERNGAALETMHRELKARGIRFVVAILPMLSVLNEEYPYADLHRLAREFCSARGIEYVDLLPNFTGRDERRLWVHPTDQHPNHIGHALIAEGIGAYLRESGL